MPPTRVHVRSFRTFGALAFLAAAIFWFLATHLNAQSVVPGLPVPTGYAQRQARAEYMANRRGLGFGVPHGAYSRALAVMRSMERDHPRRTALAAPFAASLGLPLQWRFIGPSPILNEIPTFAGFPVGTALASATGRVTAVVVDPTQSGRLLVGSGGGGIWKSSDGGATFVPVFDLEPTLAIGAIAIDPTTSPPTIYAGTGEANNSGDSYYGQGVFISTDLGNTWVQRTNAGQFVDSSISKIAVDTSVSPRHVYAAVSMGSSSSRSGASFVESDLFINGLWSSPDGGATWSHVALGTLTNCTQFSNNCPAEDVVVDPSIPSNVYAAIYQLGVFRSLDHGVTWSLITFPGIAASSIGRASIAALNGTVYAMLGAPNGVQYFGFFKSTNSGTSWTTQQIPSATVQGITLDGSSSANFSQAGFDQALAIDPADATHATVVFGGVGIYRSTDSGQSWSYLANNGGVHSDQHAIAFDPFHSGNFLAGNDGGLYSFSPSSSTWSQLNAGLPVADIQSVGPNPGNANSILAGADDNGTLLFDANNPFNAVDIGTGNFAVFDRVAPAFAYHSYTTTSAGPTLARSVDGGAHWDPIVPTNSIRAAMAAAHELAAGFYPPLASDPQVAQRVLFGAHSLYVSNDSMVTWTRQTTQDLSGGCQTGACAIQDIEFAPSAHNVAYSLSTQTFFTSPPTPFKIFQTSQADVSVDTNHPNGAQWTDVTGNLPFSPTNTQATGMTVSPFNPAVAYLTLSGFSAVTAIPHIFMTTDSGAHWTRADGNVLNLSPPPSTALPDVPVLRMLVDKTDPTGLTLIVGTDLGLFLSTDGGGTWTPFNQGVIPVVPIFDVEQAPNGYAFAATHGRGVYEMAIPTPTATATLTPTPQPTPTPTATAVVTPTATPSAGLASPTPTPSPTATPTATVTATPTPVPAGTIKVSPTRKNLGKAVFGNVGAASKIRVVKLTNKSTTDIPLFGISFNGSAPKDFKVGGGTTCANVLAARAKCSYALIFQPTALGLRSAQFVIQDNALNSPQSVSLTGTGVAGVLKIRPKSVKFANTTLGASAQKQFVLINSTTVPLTIDAISPSSAEFTPDAGCMGALRVGAACTVTVTFAPAVSGKRSGTIRITDNAKSNPQTVRVSGSGQ